MYCILHNDICKVRPVLRPRLTLADHKPLGKEIPQAQTNESPTCMHPDIYIYFFFFKKGDFFLQFSLPSTSKRHQKRKFPKASLGWSFFEDAGLSFSCGRTKIGFLVLYAIVFPSFSVFVRTGENDLNTLRVDTYFYENGGKNLRCQKYPDMFEQGLI